MLWGLNRAGLGVYRKKEKEKENKKKKEKKRITKREKNE